MDNLLKYSCQLALPGFDKQGQEKLLQAKVLIVGMGGLGCPAAQYLVSSGIGTVGVADHDTISIKNLHRQILYTPRDVGRKKVQVAQEVLSAQNPDVRVTVHDICITAGNVAELVNGYDIVLDCTDNFETRYLLNDACVLAGKPLVYGAIYQYEGQAAVWNIKNEDGSYSPNYRDLYPEVNAAQVPNCAEGGVIPTIAGIIGIIQANETIKYLTGRGTLLAGELLLFDAQTMRSRVIKMGKTTKTNITALPATTLVEEITWKQLQDDDYYLIDVRTLEEREAFHIGGVHIPLDEIGKAEISTDKPVLCYCASGRRSAEAARMLSVRYPGMRFLSLKGGVNALQDAQHQG